MLTPHLAGSTHEAQDRAGIVVAEQVVAALAGESVAHALNLPFVPEDERRVLEPFLPVAERLGRLAMALAEGPVTRIEIATAGRLASTGSRLLTSAALRGAFGSAHESLNDVNALSVAAELGVEVAEQHRSGASDYTNLLAVTVRDPQERTVIGTVLGAEHRPWLVRVHGLPLEIELSGGCCCCATTTCPGMVGRVGTLLGDAGVNIANMTLSRSGAGGDAMMAFALDDDPHGGDHGDARDAARRARAAALRAPQLAAPERPPATAAAVAVQCAAIRPSLECVECTRPRRSG